MAKHITVEKAEGTWVVRAGGAVLGESVNALEVFEADHDSVIYFPREDIAMALLDPSIKSTTCPHKGTATYYSIQTKSLLIPNAAWSYEKPNPGTEGIARHLAFDTGKVTVEEV